MTGAAHVVVTIALGAVVVVGKGEEVRGEGEWRESSRGEGEVEVDGVGSGVGGLQGATHVAGGVGGRALLRGLLGGECVGWHGWPGWEVPMVGDYRADQRHSLDPE